MTECKATENQVRREDKTSCDIARSVFEDERMYVRWHKSVGSVHLSEPFDEIEFAVVAAIEETNYVLAIALLGGPRNAQFLPRAWRNIPGDQRAECLTSVWYGNEGALGSGTALRLFREVREDLRETLGELPSSVTIHRGVNARDEAVALKRLKRISWTSNWAEAVWFARRFSTSRRKPFIGQAVVSREHVLAFLKGREEDEVIVDPAGLSDMTVRPFTDSDCTLAERRELHRHKRRFERLFAQRKATLAC